MRGANGFITSSGKTRHATTDASTVTYQVYGYPDDKTLAALRRHENIRALSRRLAGV
jgi:hypothetical protein